MIERIEVDGYRVAVERRGYGRPLIFLHGWPLHRATWRGVIPQLLDRFECITIDFPGLGETDFDERAPIRWQSLAGVVRGVAHQLQLPQYGLVAHDTGGTVARLVAADDPDRVTSMFLLNTEIPGHRPPYIELYQKLLRIPFAIDGLRVLLETSAFLRSPMGFGGCFWDLDRIDREFRDLFVRPLIRERRRALGAVHYAVGLEWSVVDGLSETHRRIKAPVHLMWGAEDPTFPIDRAGAIAAQLPRATMQPISNAKLLVHEERPDDVARAIRDRMS